MRAMASALVVLGLLMGPGIMLGRWWAEHSAVRSAGARSGDLDRLVDGPLVVMWIGFALLAIGVVAFVYGRLRADSGAA